MNAFDDTLHRVLARHRAHSIPFRTSSSLSPDPNVTIGIATIAIVTEEQIQAIALGPPDGEPEVVVRLDPIGRDVSDLLPFASFVDFDLRAGDLNRYPVTDLDSAQGDTAGARRAGASLLAEPDRAPRNRAHG